MTDQTSAMIPIEAAILLAESGLSSYCTADGDVIVIQATRLPRKNAQGFALGLMQMAHQPAAPAKGAAA